MFRSIVFATKHLKHDYAGTKASLTVVVVVTKTGSPRSQYVVTTVVVTKYQGKFAFSTVLLTISVVPFTEIGLKFFA